MLLALLRHGVAEDAGPDTDWRDEPRALTDAGRRKMEHASRGIAALGLDVNVLLTSPLARCRQTAEIIAQALAVDAASDARLSPGLDLAVLVDVLDEHANAETVVVCGHQPDLSTVTAGLIGGWIEFKKGALALIEIVALHERAGHLVALYPPAALRKLGATR